MSCRVHVAAQRGAHGARRRLADGRDALMAGDDSVDSPLDLRTRRTTFRLPRTIGAERLLIDNRVCDVVRWLSFEPRRSCAAARDQFTNIIDSGRDLWIRPKVAFGRANQNLLESLILAQDERWRRA